MGRGGQRKRFLINVRALSKSAEAVSRLEVANCAEKLSGASGVELVTSDVTSLAAAVGLSDFGYRE